jgi:hypothetical protein
MGFQPNHASELWASLASAAVALVAYFLFRHGKYGKAA